MGSSPAFRRSSLGNRLKAELQPSASTLEETARRVAHDVTRRHFFSQCGVGLGALALNTLLARDGQAAGKPGIDPANPLDPRAAPLAPKAKNVIYLFMAGAPSQLELFEDKPRLREFSGQAPPESLMRGKRFAFLKGNETLLGSSRKFARHGQCGMDLSELLPHHRAIVDDVCWLRGMTTDVFNHGPAKLFMNTGFQAPGRPSMGSWVTYGLGNPSDNLPGFVVLQSGPRGPRAGASLWSSGFLPTSYQGVPFRSGGDPILHLRSPEGLNPARERDFHAAVRGLNESRLEETGDPEIMTRINAYEMASRMQTSAPELMDFRQESAETRALYGVEEGSGGSFARNCLMARRLVERGVRFVQLYHTDWDHHGDQSNNLNDSIEKRCREVDQASAALVLDLKRRGLLEDTLVVWGGEFGRTPMGEVRATIGRDHHIDAFTMWLAGGGVKPGIHGATDELGFGVTGGAVHVHDLHATLLRQLGFDHEKLTWRFQGRDFRLTDVHGKVVNAILA